MAEIIEAPTVNPNNIVDLLDWMREYEKKNLGKFSNLKLIVFADGSGRLIVTSMSNEDEELLEFESINEIYDFLR